MNAPLSLGGVLRAAREARRLSVSELAEATRIKVQVIQSMEADDFSRIAAPIYAKGFIRLYAEQVGLDPEPLLEEYQRAHVRRVRPTLETQGAAAPGANGAAAAAPAARPRRAVTPPRRPPAPEFAERLGSLLAAVGELARDLVGRAAGAIRRLHMPGRSGGRRFRRTAARISIPWRMIGYAAASVAALALLVWALSGLTAAMRRSRERAAAPAPRAAATATPLRMAVEPAAPYVTPAGKRR